MNNAKRIPYVPQTPVAPGVLIDEYMEFHGVGKEALAVQLGVDLSEMNRLLAGETSVTPEIAASLARIFQRPASLWLGLEELYQTTRGKRGGKRQGAGRKSNPSRRYSISLPSALGQELDTRAAASGVTPYRWIVDTLTKALEVRRETLPTPQEASTKRLRHSREAV